MQIPVRNKKTKIGMDVAAGEKLWEKIQAFAEEAATKSIKNGTDLDDEIADIAKSESFNRIQIQRLVEESNTIAYNKRYKSLKSSNDRRITFPLASLDGVVKAMGAEAPEEVVNPNIGKGKTTGGQMAKAASIESSYIHRPDGKLSATKEKYMEKVAATKEREETRTKNRVVREMNSNIFKVANSLVMSERIYKNANEIFNTLLSDVPVDQGVVRGIVKKASEISNRLVESKRVPVSFMVTLSENPVEKVASHLLGEYSLIKEAEQNEKIKPLKVQPTMDVKDYTQLINIAKKIADQQGLINEPTSVGIEVDTNGPTQ